MRICIDASSVLKTRTGIGQYTYHLMDGLGRLDDSHEYLFFFYSWKVQGSNLDLPRYPGYTLKDLKIPGKMLMRSWQYLRFPDIRYFTGPFDLFHSPNYLFQPAKNGKIVCTIHDLAFLRFPGYGETVW